jgi:HK97 family phage major capsid protein
VFSEELSEDSIIPVMPLVRRNIVIAIATAIEQAIINGDTTGSHQDSDVTVATDARKAWMGYRKCAQSSAKVSLSTFTGDTLMSVRKAMGKYGVNPGDLALVVGISGYMQLLNLRDAQNNQLVTTLEKYGSGATILTGELARIYGIPIIVSEHMRETLNATGVYDGSTTTKTILLIVYKPGFLIGNRRMLTIKSAEDITTDQTVLVATQRLAFAPIYSAATDYTVGLGYNISS